MAAQSPDKQMQAEISRIYREVQTGRSISEAMADRESPIPELLTSMVATGEASGTLEEILRSMAVFYDKEYLFMEGQYGKDRPHQIFDAYIEEAENEQKEIVGNVIEETGIEEIDTIPNEAVVEKDIVETNTKPSEPVVEKDIAETLGEEKSNSGIPKNDQSEANWLPSSPGWLPIPGWYPWG